jgi:DNA adenine methylase
MTTPTRPALRYLGGKWKLAPWIIRHFPPHRVYVEPFGGAASVLLRKARAKGEVYNDIDDDVVNLFAVLRDPIAGSELARLCALTPFARAEFDAAYEPADEPVERARRLLVRSFMGFGSCASRADRTTGWRAGLRLDDASAARDWAGYPVAVEQLCRRLAGVTIEHRPAGDVLASYDSPATLFYVDPPYVHATRSAKRTRAAPSNGYTHELSDADHGALLDQLTGLDGMVVVSGYPHPLYEAALAAWRRVETKAMADGARARTEVLWINPAAQAAGGLFG